MEIEYRNLRLTEEQEEFTLQTAQDLEIDGEKLIVCRSEPGGLYAGREDGNPVLGIRYTLSFQRVMAHELGHDRWAQEELGTWEADFEVNQDGEVKGGTIDSSESVTAEIYAEVVASEYTDPSKRQPFPHIQESLGEFMPQLMVRDYKVIDDYPDYEYLENPEETAHVEKTLERLPEIKSQETERLEKVLYNTWRKGIGECLKRGRDNRVWEALDSFLDVSYNDYGRFEVVRKKQEYVQSTIEENLPDIHEEIRSRLQEKKQEIQEEDTRTDYPDATPNPSHLSAKIASEKTFPGTETDFRHKVGKYAGIYLNQELGYNPEDLEAAGKETMDKFSQDLIEHSIQIGKNEETRTSRDLNRGIEFLAEKHLEA